MFKSLYSRMLFTNLLVIFLALLLLGVLIVAVFSQQFMEVRENDMRREVGAINTIVAEKYYFKENRRAALSELQIIARNYNAAILVIDRDRNDLQVTDTDAYWGDGDATDGIEEIIDEILKGYELRITGFFNQILNEPVMTIGRPLIVNGNIEGAIFMHTKVGDIERQVRNIFTNVVIGMSLAILLSLLLVPFTARRFTRPLVEMKGIVNSYAKCDFERRLKVKSNDELGQVARSVNAMADDLQALEDMRRSFVANVSHELRSPLTSMKGFIEAAVEAEQSDCGEYLNIALSETKRMSVLVNDLLDLARIESGTIPLNRTSFDANELIRRTLITFEGKINEKGLDVDVRFEEEPAFVLADADRITQVLRNLLDNAIKFTPASGRIFIFTAVEKGWVRVTVKDTGAGIGEEDIPRIWDRFYKADKAHSSMGTGLGLSIVQRILEQHGSEISVVSREGEGASFSFSLQSAKKRGARRPEPGRSQPAPEGIQ